MAATACRAVAEKIEVLSYNVRSFRLRLEDPPTLDFQAGQFMIVNVPKNGSVVKRAYSVASPPHDTGVLELCIQHVEGGTASTYFWSLKEGDPVSLNGPHGRFLLLEPYDYDVIFMATGTGVAPLRSMIRHLFHANITRQVWLLFGCRYEHAVLYESEFRTLAGLRSNFHYVPTVSRPKEWRGATGHLQETFKKYFPDPATKIADKEIYLCGWTQVIRSICADLGEFGVPAEKLHFEEWA
ncbi:MAG TPA: FAD-binding oxidoreductase [bacterium]